MISALMNVFASADSEGAAWKESPVGKCFSSVEAYLLYIYGEPYMHYEEVVTETVEHPRADKMPSSYVWAMDTTPMRNWSRVLLRVDKKTGRACAILFTPAASFVDFKLKPSGQLPEFARSRDIPGGFFNPTEVVYRLDSRWQYYLPSVCYSISWKNGKRKKVDCNSVYRD
jgi:hypothetical protein